MADNFRSLLPGIRLVPATLTLDREGELFYDEAAGTLALRTASITDQVALLKAMQTLENKTLVSPAISGQLLLPNGTVGAPSVSFVSDPDTGVYLPSVGVLSSAVGGVEVLRLSADGSLYLPGVARIGLNATVNLPVEKLSVQLAAASAAVGAAIAGNLSQVINAPATGIQSALSGKYSRVITTSQTDVAQASAALLEVDLLPATGQTLSNTSADGIANLVLAGANVGSGVLAIDNYSQLLVKASSANTGLNKHGIQIQDQTGATNNFSIKTGLGVAQFGDVILAKAGIKLEDPGAGTNAILVAAPAALAAPYTLTLPVDGGINGYVLSTNGSGVTSWAAAGGGGGGAYVVQATRASPTLITAAGGITSTSNQRQIIFVAGNGGAVNITANPQISAGSIIGQELRLVGRSATDTVQLDNGTGLSLNGTTVLGLDDVIDLFWDGSNWVEA